MTPRLEQEIRDLRSRFWSERDPHGRGFVPLADALRRAGELDEARELLDEGLGRHPTFASAFLVSSWVHRDRGDVAEEEEAYRRVLTLDPENARALHGLGQLLARGGRLAAGRELVARAVDLDPLLEWEEGGPPEELEAAPAQEPAAEEDVVDIRSLAPQVADGILGDPDGRGPVVEISFLAPRVAAAATPTAPSPARAPEDVRSGEMVDPWAADEGEVVDIASLAPEPAGSPRDEPPLVEVGALAPDPPAPPAPEPGLDDEPDDDAVHYTRTMVELLARQGLYANALEVARRLLRRNPDDELLRGRIAELEEMEPAGAAPSPPVPAPRTRPVADEPAPDAARPDEGVTDYLRDLLSWPGPDPEGEEP